MPSDKTISQERALTTERMKEYLPLVVTGLCQTAHRRKLVTRTAMMTGGMLRI